jgi:hypothetical protein
MKFVLVFTLFLSIFNSHKLLANDESISINCQTPVEKMPIDETTYLYGYTKVTTTTENSKNELAIMIQPHFGTTPDQINPVDLFSLAIYVGEIQKKRSILIIDGKNTLSQGLGVLNFHFVQSDKKATLSVTLEQNGVTSTLSEYELDCK